MIDLRGISKIDFKTRGGTYEISDAGLSKLNFAERDKCRPVPLRLSLARNLEKPVMSIYGTKWRKCSFRLNYVPPLGSGLKALANKEVISGGYSRF
jgi:hypothetical protein